MTGDRELLRESSLPMSQATRFRRLASSLLGVSILVSCTAHSAKGQPASRLGVVLSGSRNTLTTFDVDSALVDPSATETATILFSGIGRDVAVGSDGQTAYLAAQAPGQVIVVDLEEGAVTATSDEDLGSPSAIALAPDNGSLYLTDAAPRPGCGGYAALLALDKTSLRSTATFCVGRTPVDIEVSPNGRFVYVVNSGDGTISRIESGCGVDNVDLGPGADPRALALSRDGSLAYAADFANDVVVVIDALAMRIVGSIPVVPGPSDLATATKRRSVRRELDRASRLDP